MRSLIAEFIGTFALIFAGAGAGAMGVGGLVGVALAHAFVIVGMVYAFGRISGAHVNPAVTFGLWVGGAIDTSKAVKYVVVQLLGGIAAAALLAFVLGGALGGLGETTLAPEVTPLQGVVLEAILTFFLVNSVFQTAVVGGGGNHAGLAIGLTLGFCILMGGPLTGAALNPARTLGPAIISGTFSDLWVYLVGPLAGGALAAVVYSLLGGKGN